MNLKRHLAGQDCKNVMTDFPLTTICQYMKIQPPSRFLIFFQRTNNSNNSAVIYLYLFSASTDFREQHQLLYSVLSQKWSFRLFVKQK